MSRYLTFMAIPHNEDQVREVNLSRPSLWGIFALVAIAVLALSFYAMGYYTKRSREIKLSVVRAENADLKDHLLRVKGKLGYVRDRVDYLSKTDRMMRAWASLPEPGEDVRKMGVGGLSHDAPPWSGLVSSVTSQSLTEVHFQMEQFLREARFLSTSFDSIGALLSRDDALRRHTPSISPVSPEAECWTSSGFGYRTDPFTGRRQFHNGLDIACRMGTPILATADGVISKVSASAHKHLGFYVAIDHGQDFRTVYGHLQSVPSLKLGQRVRRGEVVGRMGKSGRATAPHLHYTISINGRAANPKRYIFDQRSFSSIF